jgi:precorrin-6A synthase
VKRLLIIGIGAGDPDHVTVQAIEALNRVDVFFLIDKGADTADLVQLRKEICHRHIENPAYRMVEVADVDHDLGGPGYRQAVADWHEGRVALYERLLTDELADGQCGGILAWGDPTLYDSTLRIIDEIVARGTVELDHEVIPGISSVSVLAARHRIPLNGVGRPVHITTGRRLADGLPAGLDSVVVMLDSKGAFLEIDDTDMEIFWGAYLGTADEILIAGRLSECKGEIERTRADARARKGWLFDTYLLRRTER